MEKSTRASKGVGAKTQDKAQSKPVSMKKSLWDAVSQNADERYISRSAVITGFVRKGLEGARK